MGHHFAPVNREPSMSIKRIRVWDLPTRVFHVLLILGIMGSLFTVYFSDELMQWHARIGLFLLSLLLWRLVWGFVGGHWSRFKHFVEHPKAAWQTLQNHSAGVRVPSIGHNPMGAWSVVIMSLSFSLQAFTGMCSDDEAGLSGPLTQYLSSDWVERATWYHSEIGQPLIWVLLTLHVLVVLYYRWRLMEDLITPMITGDKDWETSDQNKELVESKDTLGLRIAALILILALCSAVFTTFKL